MFSINSFVTSISINCQHTLIMLFANIIQLQLLSLQQHICVYSLDVELKLKKKKQAGSQDLLQTEIKSILSLK